MKTIALASALALSMLAPPTDVAAGGQFDDGGHLHGSRDACDQHGRAWALLHNLARSHPATAEDNDGRQSPAERLDGDRCHDNRLADLLVSASLGGHQNHTPLTNP